MILLVHELLNLIIMTNSINNNNYCETIIVIIFCHNSASSCINPHTIILLFTAFTIMYFLLIIFNTRFVDWRCAWLKHVRFYTSEYKKFQCIHAHIHSNQYNFVAFKLGLNSTHISEIPKFNMISTFVLILYYSNFVDWQCD